MLEFCEKFLRFSENLELNVLSNIAMFVALKTILNLPAQSQLPKRAILIKTNKI